MAIQGYLIDFNATLGARVNTSAFFVSPVQLEFTLV